MLEDPVLGALKVAVDRGLEQALLCVPVLPGTGSRAEGQGGQQQAGRRELPGASAQLFSSSRPRPGTKFISRRIPSGSSKSTE